MLCTYSFIVPMFLYLLIFVCASECYTVAAACGANKGDQETDLYQSVIRNPEMVFVPSLIAIQQHQSKGGSHCVPLTWILHGFLYPIQFNTKSWRGESVEELEKEISDIQPLQLKASTCFRTGSDLRYHFQLVLPMKTSACGGCFAPSHTVSYELWREPDLPTLTQKTTLPRYPTVHFTSLCFYKRPPLYPFSPAKRKPKRIFAFLTWYLLLHFMPVRLTIGFTRTF